MSSSTSRSRKVSLALLLPLAAGSVWILCALYTLKLNPEVVLLRDAARLKYAWAEKLSRDFTNKTIIYGGSSCTFAIDGLHALEQRRFPIANLGLGAGMGARVLSRYALAAAKPGDTLILSVEPNLLTDDLQPPHLGIQFAAAFGQPWLAANTDLDEPAHIPWLAFPAALRPGGYHVFTLLGKLVRRQPLYRYHLSDFQADGRQRTLVRVPPEAPPDPGALSSQGRRFLQSLARCCRERQLRLAYALPWHYGTEAAAPKSRATNRTFLVQIMEFMPVLNDPQLGVYTKAEHFADTPWHLDGEGAWRRTEEVVREILEWDVMKEESRAPKAEKQVTF